MLFYRFYATPTAAGTWSVKLSDKLPTAINDIRPSAQVFQPQLMRQLYVKSAGALTTFDVIVEDYQGVQIRKFTTCTSVCNDLTPTPIMGDVTITVDNSSVDEAYTVLCILSDERDS